VRTSRRVTFWKNCLLNARASYSRWRIQHPRTQTLPPNPAIPNSTKPNESPHLDASRASYNGSAAPSRAPHGSPHPMRTLNLPARTPPPPVWLLLLCSATLPTFYLLPLRLWMLRLDAFFLSYFPSLYPPSLSSLFIAGRDY
jgi:hypothetical protein